MRQILLVLVLFSFLISGCAGGVGITTVALPDVQAFAYEDIIECNKVVDAPEMTDCRIRIGDKGGFITVRIQTKEVPQAPADGSVSDLEPAPTVP